MTEPTSLALAGGFFITEAPGKPISHASKVMLRVFQGRLQQHVNQELSDIQAGFRRDRGTRDQTGNICWITREFQKNIHFCFTDYAKAFDCVDHNKLWKILKEMGVPDLLTCLLRNPVSRGSPGEYQADEQAVVGGSAGDYQADE